MSERLTAIMCRICGRSTGEVTNRQEVLTAEQRTCSDCLGYETDSDDGTYHCIGCNETRFYIVEKVKRRAYGDIEVVDGERFLYLNGEYGHEDSEGFPEYEAHCRNCGVSVSITNAEF